MGAHDRRKRMRKLHQQRALAAANREVNAQTQDLVNRRLANFHILATTATDPNFDQLIAPQLLPLFPTQLIEIEPNPGNEFPIPAFNPDEIPRVPASNPLAYDPWNNEHRDYRELYPQEEPIAQYTNLHPLDPYWDNDQYVQEILNNPYPYGEPFPMYLDPVPAPRPPMSDENVQELCMYGEELIEGGKMMGEIGEKLVWKYDEREMQFNP
ncbi:hypothetical protein Hdeb2414_s0005g00184421 [Helianthus debilis subsp. tardiflorus]